MWIFIFFFFLSFSFLFGFCCSPHWFILFIYLFLSALLPSYAPSFNPFFLSPLSNTHVALFHLSLLVRPQIKLIENELMLLTKLEVKKRNLDAETLQVSVTAHFPNSSILAFFLQTFFFVCFHYINPCDSIRNCIYKC